LRLRSSFFLFSNAQILERQEKLKPGELEDLHGDGDAASEEAAIEMGITRRRVA